LGDHAPKHLDPYQPEHTATFRASSAPDGKLWLSTGIGLYRVMGGHLQTPAPGVMARSFYIARNGDLWVGTNGNGLVHLQPRLVRMFTKVDGLPNDLPMAVLASQNGHLWVGDNCGLAEYDGAHFRTFAEKDGLANSCVWALAEDHDRNLWIGSYGGGMFRYRNGVFTQYSIEQGLASRIVFQIAVARDDSLWIATPDGLSHMTEGRIHNYNTADGLSSTRILDIHQDHAGTIWIATQGGIDRFASGRFVPVPAVPATDDVLARRFVEDSRGNLYTTDEPRGFSRIEGGRIVLLDSTLNLMHMVEAPDHYLWFSSREGVIRIAEQELEQAGSGLPLNYQVFDRADGLITTQASVGSPNIASTADGKLWIATVKGLAMIDPRSLSLTGRKPQIFVAGVTSDGNRTRVLDRLLLSPGIHRVEMHLDAVDLATPRKTRLQYRMEGVDSGWLDLDASRTAVYTNIPAGTHRLLVRSTDSIGNWDAGNVIYEVTQRPHFYQTTLFLICGLASVMMLLGGAYVLRVRYLIRQARTLLEERQVERESVARDLHDTFLQGIQSLILRFHTGTQQLPRSTDAERV
jgi:ligand-binding sensor domain-containing protein